MTRKRATIIHLEKRFSYWRRPHHKKAIPERLWIAACDLSEEHPIGMICRRLGLNQNDYKRKLKQHFPLQDKKEDLNKKFIRIDSKQMPVISESNCLVEIQNSHGAILKVKGNQIDMGGIIKSFAGD